MSKSRAESPSAPAPFRLTCSATTGKPAPYACFKPTRCVNEFLNNRDFQVGGFTAIQTPARELAIALQLKHPKGGNCHAYTAQKLPLLQGIVKADDYLDPFSICGISPATALLYGATTLVAGNLPQEPLAFNKALDALSPRRGDVLIWTDSNTLVHSTTIIARGDGDWLVDDKMGSRPPRQTFASVVARELYRPPTPVSEEDEFHPERIPTHYQVAVRRPK